MTTKPLTIGIALLATTLLCGFDSGGCDGTPSSDATQRSQQEHLSQESNAQVGMPGITNFTEKRMMRRLYELRDQNLVTYTYVPDMQGRLWHLCDSIGYGLPYGTQFSNPEKITSDGSQVYGTLPQSEPNGLFMPPTAEGTWVICAGKGDFTPVYVEPRVIVSPFRLKAAGEYSAD